MKTLIVVDMQNDFITGSLGTKDAQAIVPNVKKKIEEAIANGDQIIFTRDTHWGDYLDTIEGKKLPVKHCIRNTWGWQILDYLYPNDYYENMTFIDKSTFGCQGLYGLISSSASEVEFVGLCTDICVVSNALILKSHLYDEVEISVDASCCAGVTPESHEAALKTMEMCQINVKR